jgi:E3 ubiquitin-protein ligase TRIP12
LSTSTPGAAAVLGSAPTTPAKTSQTQQMREKAHLMAKSFKQKHFSGSSAESSSSEALIQLKELSERLNKISGPTQIQVLEDICKILFKGISTFEVLQSGMAEALVEFLRRGGISASRAICSVLARPVSEEANGALVLVRELQKALDKVEKLNVAVNPAGGSGSSGLKYLTYPFKVQLKKVEGEAKLKNYGDAVIMIEPLATMSSVKDFLRRRLVLSLSQERASADAAAEPPAQPPVEGATADAPDEMQIDAQHSLNENEGKDEANDKVDGNDEVEDDSPDDEAADLDQMAQDSEDDMGASMDRSVHDIEVSEDHSSRGDLQEPDAPAQETEASKISSADVDFEIQFTLNGHEPDDSNTVFQIFHEYALRKHSQNLQPSEASDQPSVPLTRLWEEVYIIEYQRRPKAMSKSAEIALKTEQPDSEPTSSSPAMPTSLGMTSLLRSISEAEESSQFHSSLLRSVGRDAQTATILQLLRLLHEISIHADSLASLPPSTSLIPSKEFANAKLTSKLMRQLQDALMVCAGSLPLWCTFLTTSASLHFIFPFELRQLLFRATSLGISRALAALQDQLHDATDIRIGRIPRQKVRISRERILESATKVSQLVKGNRGILEVEYFNEVGTGLGPTLEFYTLVSKEVQRRDMNIWIDSSASGTWVDAPAGLFPRPTNPAVLSEESLKHFEFIGSFVAKAMFDNRLLDIPFSGAFLKKILGLPLDLEDLQPLLPDVTKSMLEFTQLIQDMDSQPEKPVLYKKAKLEDLDLYFVYPSDQSWELMPGGADQVLTSSNIREYVKLVTKAVMEAGIQKQFDAFKRGFDAIFPMKSIAFFGVDELDSLLCGSMQDHQPWDRQTILENSKFDHGYSASSRAVGYLVEVLTELTPEQRRKFLKFATGSTRLPPRGFKDMNPKLTFVRKEVDPSASPDDYMPSVNTCFGYLKLPEYSSKEMLKKRLVFAIDHGQDAFSFN